MQVAMTQRRSPQVAASFAAQRFAAEVTLLLLLAPVGKPCVATIRMAL